ncbi:MAG: hypothetical protein M3347_13415 [Armatimonadota bacterium]|nr:hypothetical protein [Armatimonadota bacterium]
MGSRKAEAFYRRALTHVTDNEPEGLAWARKCSSGFRQLNMETFLQEYVWVIYAAGFSTQVLESKFPALRSAFKDFALEKMSRMRSIEPALKVIRHERKAQSVLRGAQLIAKEGFTNFKARISTEGVDSLAKLPGIGPITKDHLARNIGLASVPKNDVWIARLVQLFHAQNHNEMVCDLSKKFNEEPGVVDYVLWQFCRDNAWRSLGFRSLETFCNTL